MTGGMHILNQKSLDLIASLLRYSARLSGITAFIGCKYTQGLGIVLFLIGIKILIIIKQ
jgi:hypothetical protein